MAKNKKLYKVNEGKMIDGVCAGIAEYFDADPTVIRLLWILFCAMGGSGIFAYIICMIVFPRKDIEYIKKDRVVLMNEIYNVNLWQIVLEGQNKLLPEDTVYQMIIGHSIKEDICEITMFISKINYENILNGVYHIRVYPYATEKVLLFDEDNNLISLVNGFEINFDNLNFYQINDITKERQR